MTYINSDAISWYAYKSVREKSKLNKSEYEACDIKKFCVRASVQLIDAKTARISYGIVPVSLEVLKREYFEHMNKPGFPNIIYQQKEIPFVPFAKITGSCHLKSFHSFHTGSFQRQTGFGCDFRSS